MMDSQLQIGLLGVGVLAVVLIVAYNRWMERKHRKRAEDAFKSAHRDVLLEPHDSAEYETSGTRLEPYVSDTPKNKAVSEPAESEKHAAPQAASKTHEYGAKLNLRRSEPGMTEALDPRTDCWIRIEAMEPIDISQLWAQQKVHLKDLSKPVRWFVFDHQLNLWRQINETDTGNYDLFCVSMQLVDRRGPLSEADFLRFCGGSQRIAEQFLSVPASVPVWNEVAESATALDRFCAEVDVQIGVNVVSGNTPFMGTKLRGLAEAQGMQLGDRGCFEAYDENGNVLFSMSNLEVSEFSASAMRSLQTNGVTLVLDVPRVAQGIEAFDRMMRAANALADALHGSVVDDNRATFGPEAEMMIRKQIRQFQQKMNDEQILAGGSLALRLFVE